MSVSAVPFITLNRFENGFREEFLSGVASLFDKTQFVGGPIVPELEGNLQTYTKSKYAIGCANGTDAIQIALRAVGVAKNDKVLVPDMTFWATFEAVVNVGANPVTVDVHKEYCHWDLATFKQAVSEFKPKAAIMVHLYGWASPDTLEIRKFAKENNVLLIEDGAQCFGTKINGESILGSALISTTSFYPAKVLGASGDAGAIFTNNEEYAKNCRILVNHGRTDHYSHGMIGWNSRIGAYESLFLNMSLRHIDQRIASRMKAVSFYEEKLKGLPYKIMRAKPTVTENGYCSVGMIDPNLRPALIESLKKANIGYGTIYPGAMSRQSGADGHIAGKIDNGNAHYVSQAVLNLPCFHYITTEELEYIVSIVKKHFN
jgi:UDP-2-acetamido-2-deoxy-ribo-hexuluronate aminotransferase